MKTMAAVLVELNRPLEIADLEIDAPGAGQVLVELSHSGVCHTQLLEARGRRGVDRFLPHCLGHEGSGVVIDTGEHVTKVKPGDRVVLSWIKGQGADVPGVTYRWGSRQVSVNAGGVTTFNRHALVSENRLTVAPETMSSAMAALLGCAAPTGVGAALNTGQAKPGESAIVFGCGGVGLCAVAGAAAGGCEIVVAVDPIASKRTIALQMGATHAIAPDELASTQEQTNTAAGFDLAIEATGLPRVMRQAFEIVKPRVGRAVIIGNAAHGAMLEIDPHHFNQGKRLLGTWGGDSDPDRDQPRFSKLCHAGKLRLDPLIEQTYPLEQINQALDDLETGKALRPLIVMNPN